MRPARTLLCGLALSGILAGAAFATTEPATSLAEEGKTDTAVVTAPASDTTNAPAAADGRTPVAPQGEGTADVPNTTPGAEAPASPEQPATATEPTVSPTEEPAAASAETRSEEPESVPGNTASETPLTVEPAAAATEPSVAPPDEPPAASAETRSEEPASVSGTAAAPEAPAPVETDAAGVEPSADPSGTAAVTEPEKELTVETAAEDNKVQTELLRLISEAKSVSPEEQQALTAFYESRGGDLIWVEGTAFGERAEAAIAEIRRADDWGLEASAFELPSAPNSDEPAAVADAELKLSLAVLKYASHARGGRMDPKQLSYNIDREPPLLAPSSVLAAIAAADTVDSYLRGLHPQHPQFERLRQAYLSLKRDPAPAEAAEESPPPKRAAAKKKSQPASKQATLRKILHNMEQWRWMPEDLGRFYVWANVPEFTLRVMRNGEAIHTERLIVGKRDTQTPIFSDEMETIVFHPFWGVPDSIKVKEILPSLARGGNVLAKNDLRIQYRGRDIDPASVDWTRTDIRNFHVYQPPGSSNVLGVVKFLFPNEHQVYMHDTPSKSLFTASQRMFSHGCMRVRDPLRFAEILLSEDKGWGDGRIASLVRSGPRNNHITLDTKVPVHVTYFTAWVDDDGKLNTRPDVYGHEQRIQMGLEGKAHLIAKSKPDLNAARAEVVGRLAETKPTWSSSPSSQPDWVRRVFGN